MATLAPEGDRIIAVGNESGVTSSGNQVTACVESCMTQASSCRRKGTAYRIKKRVPRQTRFNRSRRLYIRGHSEQTDSGEVLPGAEDSAGEVLAGAEDSAGEVLPGANSTGDSTGDPIAHDSPVSEDSQPRLYPGSLLTPSTSNLTISSYISRHHLSKQAQEDLLHLLHLHVPVTDLFPSSLHTFRKNSGRSDVGTIQQFYHYFCPRCHTNLANNQYEVCPNTSCSTALCQDLVPSFFTLSITDQLKNLFERKLPTINNTN
jgi:hypothetical protein